MIIQKALTSPTQLKLLQQQPLHPPNRQLKQRLRVPVQAPQVISGQSQPLVGGISTTHPMQLTTTTATSQSMPSRLTQHITMEPNSTILTISTVTSSSKTHMPLSNQLRQTEGLSSSVDQHLLDPAIILATGAVTISHASKIVRASLMTWHLYVLTRDSVLFYSTGSLVFAVWYSHVRCRYLWLRRSN